MQAVSGPLIKRSARITGYSGVTVRYFATVAVGITAGVQSAPMTVAAANTNPERMKRIAALFSL